MRSPLWVEAFRVCRELKIPHPNRLESIGIGQRELIDWMAFFRLLDHVRDKGTGPTDQDKLDTLKALRQQYGR